MLVAYPVKREKRKEEIGGRGMQLDIWWCVRLARSPAPHSFGLPICPFLFAHSLRTFRWIFPAALLGTSLTKTTPPVRCLCFATLVLIQPCISSELVMPSGLSTTYARGCSCAANESETPTTPASAMAGCVRRTASSSAGATWRPETLMSS